MKKFLWPCLMLLTIAAVSVPAAAPRRGKERLRELAVFPAIELQSGYVLHPRLADMLEDPEYPAEIARLRAQLRRQPDDIPTLLRLGTLLDRQGNSAADGCFERAETLSRRKSEARPQDTEGWLELAAALDGRRKWDEAQTVYRRATVISSNDWKCWLALGHALGAASGRAVLPAGVPDSPHSLSRDILKYRPAPDALKQHEVARQQAETCLDRAVALAPEEPDVYVGRAYWRCVFSVRDGLTRAWRGEADWDMAKVRESFYAPMAADDLREAARLRPDDYRLIGMSAWFECYGATKAAQRNASGTISPSALPDRTRQLLRETMARLDTLGRESGTNAAGALEMLGFFQVLLGDLVSAKATFGRAVRLDPEREQAWEMWLGAAVRSQSADELAAIGEARLRHRESARNHLLLAKALVKQEKWVRSAEQARAAQFLEPDNIVVPLMLAAIAIRQSADESLLPLAAGYLRRADELQRSLPPWESPRRWREFALNVAILSALGDRTAEARELLKAVLERYPDDANARDILRALD